MPNAETSEFIFAARALPLEARAEIVDSLVDSLYIDDGSDSELKAEVERRISAFRSGRTQLIPAEVVFAKADERLKK